MKGVAFALLIAGCLLIGDSFASIVIAAGLIVIGGIMVVVTT